MKIRLLTLIFCLFTFFVYSQTCPDPNGLFTTNITYINAQANWEPVALADHYKINYRTVGASSWLNLGNIGSNDSTRNLPQLLQSTSYEWRIKAFCDSTNQFFSDWSINDTFTTATIVYAPFNPIITNTINSLECDAKTDLYVRITQTSNEPDIETGTIVSDGGSFDITSINFGDSVGYATITTSVLTINTTLIAGLTIGQNYAIINSYDSLGSLIGFFTIENDNGGVKIQVLGSPNDNNNHTSGYISDLYFTDLFINPQNAGPLHFFSDINSELNDQVSITDTFQIWCMPPPLGNIEKNESREIVNIFNALGQESKIQINVVQFIKFSDGTIRKQILIKK